MYEEVSNLNQTRLLQGDIVVDFPFPFFEESIEFLKADTEGKLESTTDIPFSTSSDEVVKAYAKQMKVMMISQTCDIQRRERISICPVHPISVVPSKHLDSLRKRKINYWFYLPNLDGRIEESIADLQGIISLPRKLVLSYLNNKRITLSHWGRHHLCWALQGYFGRPIEDLSPEISPLVQSPTVTPSVNMSTSLSSGILRY